MFAFLCFAKQSFRWCVVYRLPLLFIAFVPLFLPLLSSSVLCRLRCCCCLFLHRDLRPSVPRCFPFLLSSFSVPFPSSGCSCCLFLHRDLRPSAPRCFPFPPSSFSVPLPTPPSFQVGAFAIRCSLFFALRNKAFVGASSIASLSSSSLSSPSSCHFCLPLCCVLRCFPCALRAVLFLSPRPAAPYLHSHLAAVHRNQESLSFRSNITFVQKLGPEVRFGRMSCSCVEGVELVLLCLY